MEVESSELDRLLRAVAEGDRVAFAALYRAAAPKLFALVLRICRDRALAERVLQDVFVAIWREAEDYDPAEGRAAIWLAVLARRRAMEAVGDRKTPRPPPATPGAAGEGVDMQVLEEGNGDFMTLIDCLGRLEKRTREMLLLAYYGGWSRAELSAHFNSAEATVRTALRRGLAALRRCLDESRG
ncbi:MAG: sigma-70 family RNA polymerase sigma factor [Pseudomonadota bacterium]